MDYIKLRNELIRDEGLRYTAYKDTNGYYTIGIGHLLGTFPRMTTITLSEVYALYRSDVDTALAIVKQLFITFDSLDDVRQRALVNMVFNRGSRRMSTSTTITPAIKIASQSNNAEDWKKVKLAINKSEWASQVGVRASRLANMLETGMVV